MKLSTIARNILLKRYVHTLSILSVIIPTNFSLGKYITQTIPTGPAGIENANVDAMEGKSPIILKATAKI